ncbi:unnamed protein product [Caenorhabditis nigoni]
MMVVPRAGREYGAEDTDVISEVAVVNWSSPTWKDYIRHLYNMLLSETTLLFENDSLDTTSDHHFYLCLKNSSSKTVTEMFILPNIFINLS